VLAVSNNYGVSILEVKMMVMILYQSWRSFVVEKLRISDQPIQEEGRGRPTAEEAAESDRGQKHHVHAAEHGPGGSKHMSCDMVLNVM